MITYYCPGVEAQTGISERLVLNMSIALYKSKGETVLPKAITEMLSDEDNEDNKFFEIISRPHENVTDKVYGIPTELIFANAMQPRSNFDEDSLKSLADSISVYGILQPLTVRQAGEERRYELIAGERRLRAAKMLGLPTVPCIIVNADEKKSAEMAIIENLQRQDLNMFEEAKAINALSEKFGMTQEKIAARLSVSQSYIANKLRLLKFSPEMMNAILASSLTERHARALLRIKDEYLREAAMRKIIEKGMNVAASEEYIESLITDGLPTGEKKQKVYGAIRDLKLFYNSLDNALNILSRSGAEVERTRKDSAEEVEINIKIRKKNQYD